MFSGGVNHNGGDRDRLAGFLIKETIHTWVEVELVNDTIQRLNSEIRDVLMENRRIETFRGYDELIAMLFSLWLQAWLVGFIRLPSGFRRTRSFVVDIIHTRIIFK